MIQKVKNYLAKIKQKQEEKLQLKKMQRYYNLLREGATFMKFIYEDLQKNGKNMNRHQRRRFERQLSKKGQFNKEVVDYYASRIDSVLNQIDARLNPPKKRKTIDAAKWYENLKKKEAQGKLKE